MRKLLLAGCALALTSVSYAATFAGTANGVYNTAVNSANVVLAGASIDSHYILIKTPTGCSGITCTDDANTSFGPDSYVLIDGYPTFGGSPWLANDTTSKWLGPRSNQTNPEVGGATRDTTSIFASDTDFYVYRMVFNLTALSLNPATANIQLRWASDNSGAPSGAQSVDSHIRMCGIANANDTTPCSAGSQVANSVSLGFSSYKTVTISSGFTSGFMALDFVVYNSVVPSGQGNPSGFRVEVLSATATPTTTPEPATFALIGGALAGLALLRRRS